MEKEEKRTEGKGNKSKQTQERTRRRKIGETADRQKSCMIEKREKYS